MVFKNISMPHPVLGIENDMKEGFFNTSCKVIVDKQSREYVIKEITAEITNPYIQSLVAAKFVDLVFKISCTPTYKTWTIINPKEIRLPENEIDVLLEVESFLIASGKIERYTHHTFSDDFGDKCFVLEKGDIVGITGSKRVIIRKENEKVSLGSIFKFSKIKTDSEHQELHFDFDDDQILIYYPGTNMNYDPVTLLFDKVQGLPYTALSLYIVPALAEAFRIMQEKQDVSSEEKKWFLVLDSILPINQRDDDPFVSAQRAIRTGLPINLAFDEIIKTKNLPA